MRLAINAGSGQEDADQSGVAHFLEHMLFNGTTEFPANDLIDTLRGFGMAFGADVNAYTRTTRPCTSSRFRPATSTTWAQGSMCSASGCRRRRSNPIRSTARRVWCSTSGVSAISPSTAGSPRSTEAMFLTGSDYEGRQPIGSDTTINAMTPDLLRRFYDRWYRPDNAAVMVVGDIDIDDVEAEIRDRFEPLTPRADTTARAEPSLSTFGNADATVLIDPDATTADVELSLPGPYLVDGSIGSLRHDTLIALAFDTIAHPSQRRHLPRVGAVHQCVRGQQRRRSLARCAERDGQWRARSPVGVARCTHDGVRTCSAIRLRRR